MSEATITLEAWTGPWSEDDPDANFKREVALYAHTDPLPTLTALGDALGVPVGALCRYVLARWASEGAAGVLELGPTMVERLWAACEEAEEAPSDEERLARYRGLAQRIGWLRAGTT